jgi:putative DNA primase/helicase
MNLAPHIEAIARRLLGAPNRQHSTRQQLRFGSNGSVAVEIAGPKRGEWYDHEEQTGGGPLDLLYKKGGISNGAALEWLQSELGIEIESAGHPRKRIAATYDYRDETGALLYQAVRFEPKGFSQRRPDGNGGWIWKLDDARRILYRLPELIATPIETTIYIPEGEKDVDRLREVGLAATLQQRGRRQMATRIRRVLPGP